MRFRPGLRARLMLGALALAVLAVAAAGLAVYGLARTQALAAEALAAQRRIEAYGALSARVNEWTLGWLAPAGPPPDAAQIGQALTGLEALVAEDLAAARTPAETAERERLSVTPARIHAEVDQLERALGEATRGTPAADIAAYHAAQVQGLAAAQVQQEVRRRDAAVAAMEALRRRLHPLALAVGVAAPLVLAGLYLGLFRPLFGRLAAAAGAAEALAAGVPAPGPSAHDELGLLLARVRRVAARVARDRARLNATVAERTVALSEANARLARIDAARRRFFADVGHELRTPLTVILGEAELGAGHADAGAAGELCHDQGPGAAALHPDRGSPAHRAVGERAARARAAPGRSGGGGGGGAGRRRAGPGAGGGDGEGRGAAAAGGGGGRGLAAAGLRRPARERREVCRARDGGDDRRPGRGEAGGGDRRRRRRGPAARAARGRLRAVRARRGGRARVRGRPCARPVGGGGSRRRASGRRRRRKAGCGW